MKKKILIVLTLCSILTLSIVYARYISSEYSDGRARVVKFGNVSIVEEGRTDNGQYIIEPGEINKKVTVKFDGSETRTTVYVSFICENWQYNNSIRQFSFDYYNDENDNNDLYFTISDGWEYDGEDAANPGTHVFKKSLEPNNVLESVIVEGIMVGEEIPNSKLSIIADKIDLSIKAKVVQDK